MLLTLNSLLNAQRSLLQETFRTSSLFKSFPMQPKVLQREFVSKKTNGRLLHPFLGTRSPRLCGTKPPRSRDPGPAAPGRAPRPQRPLPGSRSTAGPPPVAAAPKGSLAAPRFPKYLPRRHRVHRPAAGPADGLQAVRRL